MPLGNDYWAHLLESDAYDSFSEIFIQQEYLDYLPEKPPLRILDLGAHYGYFSLWIQSIHPENDVHSLLIEPSPNCSRSLQNLIKQKSLKNRFLFLPRAIGNAKRSTTSFYDRPHMASSCFSSSGNENLMDVSIISENEILETFAPPYDLIKCEIEGSEWEILQQYSQLLESSKHLTLEWHSWHNGGGGYQQLVDKLQAIGYDITKSSNPTPALGREGQVGLILARNLKF